MFDLAPTVAKRGLADGLQLTSEYSGDDAAIGATNAPAAVALAGFDDQRGVADLAPALTTVHSPTNQVGQVAAQQLLRCIAGEKVERVTRLATTVVIRQSCGCM